VQGDKLTLGAKRKEDIRRVFSDVYAQNRSAVFGYFRARTFDSNDAEDLTQEVFLRAFGALNRFDTTQQVRPWLMGIGRNVLREHVRKAGRRKEVSWTELCIELEDMLGDDSPYEDVMNVLPLCMKNLSESAAQALHWHYMGGQKLQQIADRMGRTLGAVKVLMVRARQALKRCFEKKLKQNS